MTRSNISTCQILSKKKVIALMIKFVNREKINTNSMMLLVLIISVS